MSPTDLIICYLSLAAPFGVFRYLYGWRGLGRRKTFRSVGHGALWPIFLTSALVELVATGEPLRKPENSDVADAYRHVGVDDLQRELEILTLSSSSGLSLFEVRESLERYAALTRAASYASDPDPEMGKDLFEIGASANRETASMCLSRRNLARLLRHQQKARADVLALTQLCAPAYRKEQAIRTAQTLFAELRDDEGIRLLHSMGANGDFGHLASETLAPTAN